MNAITQRRIRMMDLFHLTEGPHRGIEDGVCAMELVSYLAGEAFSDAPKCTSPAIAGVVRRWNDALPDADRDRLLKPLLPQLIGTRCDDYPEVESLREYLAIDWSLRVHTPAWLHLVESCRPHAAALREMPEIKSSTDLDAAAAYAVRARQCAASALSAVRRAVAAESEDWRALKKAAKLAAWSASWMPAWYAAEGAAVSAAWSAACAAAMSAAKSEAMSAIEQTVDALQLSTQHLIQRMISCDIPGLEVAR